jgi:hypothetical protein
METSVPRPEPREDGAITGAGAGSPLGAGARALRGRAVAGHGGNFVSNFHDRDPGGRHATLPVEAA